MWGKKAGTDRATMDGDEGMDFLTIFLLSFAYHTITLQVSLIVIHLVSSNENHYLADCFEDFAF